MHFGLFARLGNALTGNRSWSRPGAMPQPQAARYDVSSSAAAAMASRPPTTSPRSTASPTSPCSRRAGSAPATPAATRRSSAPTTCCPATSPFYEWSLKLWEGLEQDLNYNVMVSQRGVLNLYHSDAQRDAYARRGNAMRLNGVDAELLDREQVRRMVPFLDFDERALSDPGRAAAAARRHRAPRRGGLGLCPRRRPARRRHHPEMRGHRHPRRAAAGSPASRRRAASSRAGKVGDGGRRQHARASPSMAGLRLPIESHVLQAFVSEAIKPLIDRVVTFGAGHFYISQSDKGGLVFGGDIDGYNSYAQRGNLPMVEDVCEGGMALMPDARARCACCAHWGGIMDMTMDGSPIIDRTPVDGLYLNCGWCYGGFKATPASGLVLRPSDRQRRAASVRPPPIGSTASHRAR